MELQTNISVKDYIHFTFMHVRRWRPAAYHIFLFTFSFIINVLIFIIPLKEKWGFMHIIGVILFTVNILFLLTLFLSYFMARSAYNSNSFLKLPLTYTFSDTGMIVKTSHSQANCTWDMINRIKRSSRIIAIYIARNQAYIIPKSTLQPDQLQLLSEIFKKNISPSKL